MKDDDLYMINISDGKITRLTPDGKWLIHLRLDEVEAQNHSVTDYCTVLPTLSFTRYPMVGTTNPKTTLQREIEHDE